MYQPAPDFPPHSQLKSYSQDPQGSSTAASQPDYSQPPGFSGLGLPDGSIDLLPQKLPHAKDPSGLHDQHSQHGHQVDYKENENYNQTDDCGRTRGVPIHQLIPAQYDGEQTNQTEQTETPPETLSGAARLGFIRKVFCIVTTQFTFTAACVCLTFVDRLLIQQFYQETTARVLVIVSLFTYMICLYAIACYRKVARSVPINYILIGIFTVSISFIAVGVSTWYEPLIVTAALTISSAMTIGLTVASMRPQADFSGKASFLFGFMFMSLTAAVWIFFLPKRIGTIAISCGIILLVCLYIVFNLQNIMDNRGFGLQIDDYAFAAMMLYLNIIRMLMELLNALADD